MHRPPVVLPTLCLLAFAVLPATAWSADPVARDEGQAAVRATVARDNLWNIARDLQTGPGLSRQQWMVAILRQNTAAFEDGNMHRLRRDVSLTLPTRAQAAAEDPALARALVEQHRTALTRGAADPLPARQASAAPEPAPAAAETPVAPVAPVTAVTGASTPASAPASASVAVDTPAVRAPSSVAPEGGARKWWPVGFGLALAAAAFWIWRRPRREAAHGDDASDAPLASTFLDEAGVPRRRKALIVEVSQAAADMAREVETLHPVSRLVQRHGDPAVEVPPAPDASALGKAYRELQVDLARAQIETGRLRDAQATLDTLRREGTAAQQREAETLALKLA